MRYTEFVVNPSNGFWGLAERGREVDLLRELSQKQRPQKVYIGTQLLVLNTTNSCNLRCVYCSAEEHHSVGTMSIDLGRLILEKATDLSHLPKIVFHGSEPLKNYEFVRQISEERDALEARTGKRLELCMQSNLTLLNPEILETIRRYSIGVSTSLDGMETEHNLNRSYADGSPSFQDVKRGIRQIADIQGGITAICAVTNRNVNALEQIYECAGHLGVNALQFIPAVPCGEKKEFLADPVLVGQQFVRIFDRVLSRSKEQSKPKVINLEQYLNALFLTTGTDSCRMCTGANEHPLLAIDIDGSVYPCDFFWGIKALAIGNVKEDSLEAMFNSKTNLRCRDIEITSCNPCDWKRICGGGCLADSIFSKHPYYCRTHRTVFDYLSKKLPEIIEKGTLSKVLKND